jgi:hypothetical protein
MGLDAIRAEVLRRGRTDHARGAGAAARQTADEIGDAVLQFDLERILVYDAIAFEVCPDPPHQPLCRLLVIFELFISHAIEVEFRRNGVPRGAVMERHAFAQVKGVGLAVRRDVPALSEGGDDPRRRLVVATQVLLDKALEYVQEHAKCVPGGRRMRVHSLRLGFDADDQRLSVGRPRSRPARHADDCRENRRSRHSSDQERTGHLLLNRDSGCLQSRP